MRSEDLEALTLADESIDIIVTEDVLEHVYRPKSAFAEIARVLRPGGVHVFTVPFHSNWPRSRARVSVADDGEIEYLEEREYHGDPLNPSGVLVVTDFGADLVEIISDASGMTTEVLQVHDPKIGVLEPCTVFVSRKGPSGASDDDD